MDSRTTPQRPPSPAAPGRKAVHSREPGDGGVRDLAWEKEKKRRCKKKLKVVNFQPFFQSRDERIAKLLTRRCRLGSRVSHIRLHSRAQNIASACQASPSWRHLAAGIVDVCHVYHPDLGSGSSTDCPPPPSRVRSRLAWWLRR